MTEHPITPPSELLHRWDNLPLPTQSIFVLAAQWGADQELEACCEWISNPDTMHLGPSDLRAARRPKPPSLKELAMALLQPGQTCLFNSEMQDTIRRALEALPDA